MSNRFRLYLLCLLLPLFFLSCATTQREESSRQRLKAPVFTIPPRNVTLVVGQQAEFEVAVNADANPAPIFTWQFSSDGGTTWDYPDMPSTQTYGFAPATVSQSFAQYRCIASNAAGVAVSEVGTLIVKASENIEYRLSETYTQTETITCKRVGKGQIAFTIQRSADKSMLNFLLLSKDYVYLHRGFQAQQTDFDAQTWRQIQGIFDGTVNIGGDIPANDLPSQTWFSAYVQTDEPDPVRLANAQSLEKLSALQAFIESRPRP